jgi:RsiW-degrading membrane proteinase PrsW (M82 family)
VGVDLLIAFLGGVLPTFVWLFFWLMEDRCEPEPKRYIVFAFFAGMVVIAIALYLEFVSGCYYSGGYLETFKQCSISIPARPNLGLLVIWALIEECMKFGAAYFVALRLAAFDEPLDAVIYLVTVALGFSALENALFLFTPLFNGEIIRSIVTEDLRFMGASLLHSLTAVTIGLFLAWSFYQPRMVRIRYASLGLILAITLHTLFNFFILNGGSSETIWVFLFLWLGIIVALLLVERIKEPKDYC